MPKRASLVSRFLEKIEIDELTGCWNWTGAKNSKGYGNIGVGKTVRPAHQVSYDLYCLPEREPNNPNHHVRHRCHNPSCVNPDHLTLGSHQQNMQDKVEKYKSIRKEIDQTEIDNIEDDNPRRRARRIRYWKLKHNQPNLKGRL